jgi:predicted HTH transcriptional regulator
VISTISIENKTVVVVWVEPSISAPISVRGKFFRRVGRSNQRMSYEEIMHRMIGNLGISWDAFIEQTAALEELSSERIKRFMEMVRHNGRQPVPENTSQLAFLQKVKLIVEGKPTRAAVLRG